MIDMGAWKEASITAKADFARRILEIIDDSANTTIALKRIEKLARKAKRKEDRYWRKMWKDVE